MGTKYRTTETRRGYPERKLPKNRDDHSALLQLNELSDESIEKAIFNCPEDLLPAFGLDNPDKSQVRWRPSNEVKSR